MQVGIENGLSKLELFFWEREERKTYQAYHKDRRYEGPDKVIVEGNPATIERNNGEVKCPSQTNKEHIYFMLHRNTEETNESSTYARYNAT